MCGRYAIRANELRARFARFNWSRPEVQEAASRPRYNVAPGQRVLAVTNDPANPEPTVELLKWGLVPSWSRDERMGFKMINARSEGIESKPAFRSAWKSRRAVIFADGFIEWRTEGKEKHPFLFELAGGRPFCFAGLWESWSPPEGGPALRSCTVITTEPNALVATVHDRMPVLLDADQIDAWLGSAGKPEVSQWLLRPYPAEQMTRRPVSMLVNKVANDSPEVLQSPAQAG